MREGCDHTATKRPEVVLYADQDHAPVVACPQLLVCREHATDEAAAELFQTDRQRHQIAAALAEHGLARPDWGLCYAQWVDLA